MSDENFMADTAADARDGTIELVSAYVSNTNVRLSASELQDLIRETFSTLANLSGPSATTAEPEASVNEPKSKAEIRKSIGAESLISFEGGKSYKSLKRHLSGRGLTPADYRAKHGLPADYPMTHPVYSARRSELAKSIGLGSKGRQSRGDAPAKAKKPRAGKSAE